MLVHKWYRLKINPDLLYVQKEKAKEIKFIVSSCQWSALLKTQRWEITEYNYSVIVLKFDFKVYVLFFYIIIFIFFCFFFKIDFKSKAAIKQLCNCNATNTVLIHADVWNFCDLPDRLVLSITKTGFPKITQNHMNHNTAALLHWLSVAAQSEKMHPLS